jgi:sarcosine oxidase
MAVVREPRAGLLRPEACVAAHLRLAASAGVEIHTGEPILEWRADGDGVVVATSRGSYRAGRLILCAGAAMTNWLGAAGVPATVTRQPMFWFRPGSESYALGSFPVWSVQIDEERLLYGFPDLGDGLKAAIHYGGTPTTAESIDRTVHDADAREVEELLDRYFPGVHGACVRASVCMYTNTPDKNFVIDSHPAHANVLVVSACSGHGFKFASAIGEAASQWALDGAARSDLSLFSIGRFGPRP